MTFFLGARLSSPVSPPPRAESPGQQLQQPPPLSPPPTRTADPLNQLLSLMPTASTPIVDPATQYNTQGHRPLPIPPPMPDLSVPPPSAAAVVPGLALPPLPPPPSAPAPDINDLWARLQSSGVLSLFGGGGGIPGLAVPVAEAGAIPGKFYYYYTWTFFSLIIFS
jgi:hypothetical protein